MKFRFLSLILLVGASLPGWPAGISMGTLDSGGGRGQVGRLTWDASLGGFGVPTVSASGATTHKTGYIGQLTEVRGLELTSVPPRAGQQVPETGETILLPDETTSLGGSALLDDGTYLALWPDEIRWVNPRFPLFPAISSAGLARAERSIPANTNAMVRGSFLAVTGQVTLVVVPAALRIRVPPLSQQVPEGTDAELTVEADGFPPLEYQWYWNGSAITRAASSSLRLLSLRPRDEGDYRVQVQNAAGQVSTNAVVFVIRAEQPARIDQYPAQFFARAGVPAVFRVSASGTAPLAYQWRLNGVNLTDRPTMTGSNLLRRSALFGSTSDVLTVVDPQPADVGLYNVAVQNALGAQDSPAVQLFRTDLDPLSIPLVDEFDERATLRRTGTGILSGDNTLATAEPGEPYPPGQPATRSVWVSWQAPATGVVELTTVGSSFDTRVAVYTGLELSDLESVVHDEDSGDFGTSHLVFNAVRDGTYHVAVDGFAGAFGRILLRWKLNTNELVAPVIVQQPISRTVTNGSTVVLEVVATNPPFAGRTVDLKYRWRHNDLDLANAPGISGSADRVLTLTSVGPRNVGTYQVFVSNPQFTIDSHPAALEIADPSNLETVSRDKFEDALAEPALGEPIDSMNSAARWAHLQTTLGPQSVLRTGRPPLVRQSPTFRAGLGGFHLFHNFDGTHQKGETNHGGKLTGRSKWFRFLSETNLSVQLTTEGSFSETATDAVAILGVYTGTNLSTLVPVVKAAIGNASDNRNAMMTLEAKAGQGYFVVIETDPPVPTLLRINWNGIDSALLRQVAIDPLPLAGRVRLFPGARRIARVLNVDARVGNDDPRQVYAGLGGGDPPEGPVTFEVTTNISYQIAVELDERDENRLAWLFAPPGGREEDGIFRALRVETLASPNGPRLMTAWQGDGFALESSEDLAVWKAVAVDPPTDGKSTHSILAIPEGPGRYYRLNQAGP